MGTGATTGNGWEEWKNAVLNAIQDQKDCSKNLSDKLDHITEEVIKLKVKSGIWGMLGGSIPVLIGLGIYIIKELLIK